MLTYRIKRITRALSRNKSRAATAGALGVFCCAALTVFTLLGNTTADAKDPYFSDIPEVAEMMANYERRISELEAAAEADEAEPAEASETPVITFGRKIVFSELPPETEYVETSSLLKGVEVVETEALAGLEAVISEFTYVNGDARSIEMEQKTVREAVNGLVYVGTGEKAVSNEVQLSPLSLNPDTGVMTVTVEGETLSVSGAQTFKATAYCACAKCCGPYASGITSTGTTAKLGTVAVDPSVIPYGTKMYIVSDDGMYVYGYAVAEDCGGAIKKNRIDLFFPSHEECLQFGVRNCTVYFLA